MMGLEILSALKPNLVLNIMLPVLFTDKSISIAFEKLMKNYRQ
jgi:hypothetical protein